MTAGMSLSSDISSYINTIYQGAMLVARERNLMSALVTTFGDRTGVASRSNSQYSGATMNEVGEDDDLTPQKFTPSVLATLTPTEKGAQYFLSDTRLETDPFTLRADAALDLGQSITTKIETDLLSQFSSLTGGTVGTAGSVITWGYFFAMASRLKAQKAPKPYYFVCHDYQWHVLAKAVAPGATVTNAPAIQDEITRNFYVGTVGGVEIYTTSNITVDASDDAYCAMFSAQALGLDMRRAPRLEYERDSSRRGWELNLSAVYAAGIWRPAFGIQGIFDASTPTS